MKVVVATVEGTISPAHLALHAEGIKHETPVLTGMFGYWQLLTKLWADGESFILLEHDVTPWPNSLQLLWDCPEGWCVHEYPHGEPPQLIWALGACKFSAEFMESYKDSIPQLRWEQLDHFPRGILKYLVKTGPHIHQPGFAHVKLRDRHE